MSNKFAAIPDIGNTVDSLRDACQAMKQMLETLTQQRGAVNKPAGAVTFADLISMGVIDSQYVRVSTITTSTNINDFAVNVKDFGADPTGVSDSTTAIQNAINSLTASGGTVLFPVGNYKVSSPLSIGNGTTSAVSTRSGVVLLGAGDPNASTASPFFNGYTTTNGPKLTWAGGTSTSMILINGPLSGWGIRNLFLDGVSTAGLNGILVTSASFGSCSDLTLQNFGGNAIASTSNPIGGYSGVGKVDSLHNNWTNLSILVPAIAAAKGIVLTGDAGGTSDTDYNTFSNVFVRTPGGVANFGVYLAVCDSNAFDNLAVSGFSGGGVGMQLDYSSNNSFPSSNSFFQYEVGSFANAGAPGGFATANKFYGLVEANTAPAPTMANTYAVDGVWKTFTPGFSWTGTATFIVNSAKYKMIGKSTYIEVDFSISAAGTLSNLISFTLPSVPNSGGALPGINYNTAALAGCSIKTGNTTANCVQSALANWALNDRTSFSGVYENQ